MTILMFTIKFVMLIVILLINRQQFHLYKRIGRAEKYNDWKFAKQMNNEMTRNTIICITLALLIIFL